MSNWMTLAKGCGLQGGHAKRLLLGTVIALASFAGAPAPSAGKAGTSEQVRARYAVAGIASGMSSSQVADAASKAGYQLVSETKGDDWAEALRSATSARFEFDRPKKGVRDQEYKRGGERISVNYLPMPGGSIAALIGYSAPLGVLSFEQAEAELTRRYGRRSFGQAAGAPWSMWCAKQAKDARDCLNYARITLSKGNDGVSIYTDDPAFKAEQVRLFRQHSGAKASF